ncbi:transporter substrate-binding domain-containing protein [Rhodohalobacter sp. SW132]|uniref:transporter substrate-binding domain-containing protein n=1 Tax=Rhodohalobacter sp. SW132 TaxID=2293433 RepID=UPI001314FDDD|nr:transporter substrate-binding domain-containing protein [Rhodohalobacter sp. SW132]
MIIILAAAPLLTVSASELPDQADEAVIGIRVAPPFVIEEEDGTYSGLTIALWEHIADQMGTDFRYTKHDIQGLLDGAADGSLYASASALTITSEREESVDFTHPFFVTGLGIAVSYQPTGAWQSFLAIFSFDFLWVLLLLFLLLLFWGFLVWIFERKENTEEFGGSAAEGVGSGFWWAAVTMTTVGYGDKSPRTLGGRIIGFIWMFTGIVVISFFTASIASSLTVTQLDTRVSGSDDLPFVRVGALQQSATMDYLDTERIRANSYETVEAGLRAVEENEIDAFVHDAPIIQYFTQLDFRNSVRVLPNTFNDQYYGIAMPLGAEYRNDMNRIILDYIASEEWEELRNRYLGD